MPCNSGEYFCLTKMKKKKKFSLSIVYLTCFYWFTLICSGIGGCPVRGHRRQKDWPSPTGSSKPQPHHPCQPHPTWTATPFCSVIVTERRTNKAGTAPDSHPVFFLNTWKTSETKQGIFLHCSSAPFPQQARTTYITQALHAEKHPAESRTIVLLFASWYILLPRSWA